MLTWMRTCAFAVCAMAMPLALVIPVREPIPKGGESRAIDLRGAGKRSTRRIDFWYDTARIFQGKAGVTVFEMK